MSNKSIRENPEFITPVEKVLQDAYRENEDFNTALNGADTLKIASLIPDRDDYSLERSEILFWVDRISYYDEMEYWQEAYIEDTHTDAVQQIKSGDLIPVFLDLVDAIKRNRIAPFIGAGMSLPSGFPLWGAALEQLLLRVNGCDNDQIRNLLKAGEYLQVAQHLWQQDETQVKNFIRTRFAKGQISQSNVKGPINLLPKLCRGCLITTNFDCIIENVVGNLEGYMHGIQQGNKFVTKLIKGERCILKLHGDAEDHDTYIFTEEQYRAAYGEQLDFSRPLPRALRQIFISHSLLFLGCSLEQDKTLELFKAVCEQGEFDIPDHFAILPEPVDSGKKNQKESRLLEMQIRPLWYPSADHDFVEKYLNLAIDMVDGRIDPF